MNKYQQLCLDLGVEEHLHHVLKQSLTHYSYTQAHPKSRDGSRFVFLGQTAFKGEVAKILFEYVPGTGMQIQNLLGNLFKNKHLEQIFNYYNLQKYVRIADNSDGTKLKHIFTYGILGFLQDQADETILHEFIAQHFISKAESLLETKSTKERDYKAQCFMLYQQHKNCKPKLSYDKKDKLHWVKILVNDEVVATVHSKNYKYAHKKAWKEALKALADEMDKALIFDDNHIASLIDRTKKQRAEEQKVKDEKLQAFFAKNAEKSAQAKARKAELKKEAQERDQRRREAKRKAKERKALKEKQQMLLQTGLQNISASKRRILEDRGILPKQK